MAVEVTTESLGRQIRAARIKAGLTLQDVQDEHGIDKATLSRIETGFHEDAKIKTLRRVAEAVGCRLEVRFVRP